MEWTVLKLITTTAEFFKKKNIPTARLDAELLLADTLKLSRVQLYTRFDQPIAAEELTAFRARVTRRAAREPIAYILGHKEFWSLDFAVGPGVLIPRPDTERLVEEAIQLLGPKPKPARERKTLPWNAELGVAGAKSDEASGQEPVFRVNEDLEPGTSSGTADGSAGPLPTGPADGSAGSLPTGLTDGSAGPLPTGPADGSAIPLSTAQRSSAPNGEPDSQPTSGEPASRGPSSDPALVLDLCTGTAIIPVCLARETGARVIGVDISPEALEFARRNVEAHGLSRQVAILQGDLAAPVPTRFHGRFDLLTANPPYISEMEIEKLEPEVSKHEPRLALVGGPDGLEVYRRIATEALKQVKPGGWVLLEIGSEQGEAVHELLASKGLIDVEVLKDLAGQPRVVKGRRPV